MSKFGKDLIVSLSQAVEHARGRKKTGMRVTVVDVPDVRAIRKSLHMSQQRFAVSFRIPLATLKNCRNWGQSAITDARTGLSKMNSDPIF
jgi:putative transcriptional regulator